MAFGAWLVHDSRLHQLHAADVPDSVPVPRVLRKSWLAAAGFVLLFTALKSVSSHYPAVEWPMQAVLYTALAAGALRFGLVTLTIALYTADMALNIPVTLNPSAWYFT